MNPWHEVPFCRLFLPFISGILLGINGLKIYDELFFFLLFLVLWQFIFVVWTRKLISYRYRWIPGFFINVFLVTAGVALGHQQNPLHQPTYFGNYRKEQTKGCWLVKIKSPPQVKPRSVKLVAEVKYFIDHQTLVSTSGTALLYLKKEDKAQLLKSGDRLLINTQWKPVPRPSVPGTFDYGSFLKHKNIYYQSYLNASDWKHYSSDSGFSLLRIASYCQQFLVNKIKEQQMNKEEEAVGCAMILGYTEGFGQDLQGAYSRAGVTHILSVSGLHVGLIFLVFNKILFFLDHGKKRKRLKTLLLILLTWMYALLTGLSPSVQRAAFMFSFLILGQSINRKNNIINTLFISAFILVWIRPSILYDYGFQLSYLAVIGIVKIQPVIYRLVYVPNKVLDKIWEMTAVTLAAQLATSPVAIFYFHQFPTWFIPANLMVIPLSSVVMYLGIILLITSPLPLFQHLVTYLFGGSVRLMNYIVKLTDHLPYPVIEGLYPSLSTLFFSFLLILTVTVWVYKKEKQWFRLSLLSLLGFLASLNVSIGLNQRREEMLFFSFHDQDWFGSKSGRKLTLYYPRGSIRDTSDVKYSLKAYCQKYQIRQVHCLPAPSTSLTLFQQGKKRKTHLIFQKIASPDVWIRHLLSPENTRVIFGTDAKGKKKWMSQQTLNKLNINVIDLKSQGSCVW